MKKSTKLGAVACAMALAMGTALPAMAALTENDGGYVNPGTSKISGTDDATGGSGKTTVNLAGVNTQKQLVAEIPITITVAAPTTGGELVCPTPGTYAIANKSEFPIDVTNATAAPGAANWEIDNSISITGINSGSNNKIKFAVQVPGTDQYGDPNDPVDIVAQNAQNNAQTNGLADLKAAAASKDATTNEIVPTKIALDLSGVAKPANSGSFTGTQKAAIITWTVAKDTRS